MHVEWWYWIVAGFILISLELVFPSFTIIWVGTGALTVGILTALWPGIPVVGQVLLWSLASIVFTVLWFKYLKPRSNRNHSGSRPWIAGK